MIVPIMATRGCVPGGSLKCNTICKTNRPSKIPYPTSNAALVVAGGADWFVPVRSRASDGANKEPDQIRCEVLG